MAQNDSGAEKIFRKSEEEMSEIEKMMADILEEYGDHGDTAENKPTRQPARKTGQEERRSAYASPEPPVRKPRPRSEARTSSAPRGSAAERREAPSAVQAHKQNVEREKNITKEAKKRSAAPVILLLVLIVLLVLGTIVYTKVFEDIRLNGILPSRQTQQEEELTPAELEAMAIAAVTFPPDMVFPTPENEEAVNAGTIIPQPPAGSIVIISDTPVTPDPAQAQTEETPVEHSYQFFTEDLSWTQAQQKCLSLGGHLAVVSSLEELNEITALASSNGIQKVWLGCHRENGELVWENNETVDFYAWGRGEPSLYDSGDNVAEDYLLLWYFNGAWVYNDSRDDPVHDYPQMYSGQIGYVCEFGK
ncbi:MAG: hypothetical protein IJI61_06565 [Oscillospiraceae bacterium]|nr:hypothetical protein [Oscillospiraceae bacterium]